MMNRSYHGNRDLSQYTFLVTGGAGFVGSNIVEYLIANDAGKVRVLDNFSTGRRENIEAFFSLGNFELITGDIRDLEICRKAVQSADYVLHQAALGSVPRSISDPVTTNDVNISGFLNMLVAASDPNVKRFVYAASSSTYGSSKSLPKVEDVIGRPLSPYAVTKFVNELYAQVFADLHHLPAVGLRYFNVFGPKQDPEGAYAAVIPLFMKNVLERTSPFINGDGEQTRDFTFVENVVQANICALFANIKEHQVINVANGERTSLNVLWGEINALAGTSIRPFYRDDRAGDIRDSFADISKAGHYLGYKPARTVREGLQITFDWYKKIYGK